MLADVSNSEESARVALLDAASDPAAATARRSLCRALPDALRSTGRTLIVTGHFIGPERADRSSPSGNGNDLLVALGLLCETVAALVEGVGTLLTAGNYYAAGALARQLVEAEYLAWAFSDDQDEAKNWLRSTDEERRQRWQPRHLRQRSAGRFRGKDYAEHCEFGGHPTPDGCRLLLSAEGATFNHELLLFETAQHASSAWFYLLLAIVVQAVAFAVDASDLVDDKAAKRVGAAEAEWRNCETLADVWKNWQAGGGD